MRGKRYTPEQIATAADRARAALRKLGARPETLPDDPAAAIDLYLTRTHDTLTMRAQAAALGLSVGGLKWRRDRLYEAGAIRRAQRAGRTPITPEVRERIGRLWAEGYSAESIARMHQVTKERVFRVLNAGPRPARPRFYTRNSLERIFAVADSTLDSWLGRGWLPCAKSQPDVRWSHHRWVRADLIAFLRVREAWMAYDPRQMTDPELRALAERLRAEAGGEWVSVKEIAARLGVAYTTLKTWCYQQGYLAGYETASYGPARYVWLPAGAALPPAPVDRRYKGAA